MTLSPPPKSLVLHADDDPDDVELIRDAFAGFSHSIELLSFSDGVELLDFIKQLTPFHPTPCLFILDINMPRMDGKETLRTIRRTPGFEEIPAVLFSTSTLPADAAFAQHHNAGFVTKPLHARQIHKIVDQIIDHCADDVKKRINQFRGK